MLNISIDRENKKGIEKGIKSVNSDDFRSIAKWTNIVNLNIPKKGTQEDRQRL